MGIWGVVRICVCFISILGRLARLGFILGVRCIRVRIVMPRLTPIRNCCIYPRNGTGCVPCPRNMKYSSTEKICICDNTSLLETLHGCFTSAEIASTNNLGMSSSKYYNNLKYVSGILWSCFLPVAIITIWGHVRNWWTYARTRWATPTPQTNPNANSSPLSPTSPPTTQSTPKTASTSLQANSQKTNRSQ